MRHLPSDLVRLIDVGTFARATSVVIARVASIVATRVASIVRAATTLRAAVLTAVLRRSMRVWHPFSAHRE